MLTGSLIVMGLVRVLHYLGNKRGRTLGEMLGSLNLGYRLANDDHAAPGDAAQAAFVLDVLTHPTLHTPSRIELARTKRTEEPRYVEKRRELLAQTVEYIAEADLRRIVRRLARLEIGAEVERGSTGETDSDDRGLEIPARWHEKLPPSARKLETFVAYISDWFRTAEGQTTEQFKVEARRLTAVISCILVVLFNLDGLALATNLFQGGSLRAELSRRAPDLLDMSDPILQQSNAPPAEREELLDGVADQFSSLNSTLNHPDLGIGWQHSWIAQSFCAECGPKATAPQRSLWPWAWDVGRWLFGLILSSITLSFGAPFWANQLRSLLNLQNSLKQAKDQDRKDPATA
jgi:hypothetical protein